ncbi:MAG: redox-regulated ATPase YchF, partial [Actinobacteria bacterium]|nr:redox-regulated ATPase YchF [Actinomycetota bacterium]NIS32708.1 redox-regulated ATPase YchF [Actinomycetota bacterium]NIT96399.1 redox-regulated ATPase YchF [Actinomycetota bacterium]NIU20107.1 redox-regulated ATPase YchF [Actinomycetota bacterium]NIU67692.1 redox-regulated ATPase YchF [Actinomycetota bacterium]
LEQLRVVEIELALADLASAEKALEKTSRMLKGDRSLKPTAELLEKVVIHLSDGVPLYRAGLDDEQRARLREFFLLTDKPVLAVLNIGEDQIGSEDELAAPVRAELAGAEVVPLSVQLEAEAAQLDEDERAEMLDALGLGEGAVPRFLRSAYHLLGLRTFFTTGEKESRAWTFRAGSTAPECAGVIHTDFQRGFIRAETIQWDELLAAGSWTAARDLGKVRSEGKDYLVEDGDVMEFRFNV